MRLFELTDKTQDFKDRSIKVYGRCWPGGYMQLVEKKDWTEEGWKRLGDDDKFISIEDIKKVKNEHVGGNHHGVGEESRQAYSPPVESDG